jgi:flagellar motor switch protein FliN
MMTADDGLLSQDEIDALTAGLLGGGGDDGAGAGAAGGDAGSSARDTDAIRPVVKLLCEQSSSVLTTVLSKEVEVRMQAIQAMTAVEQEAINAKMKAGALVVKTRFNNEINGMSYLVVGKKLTAVLSDLMMMGNGEVEYEEDHKDALTEMVNQVMGSSATAIGSEMGMKVEIGQSEISEFNPEDPPFPLDDVAQVSIELKVAEFDTETVYWIFDTAFLDSFVSDSAPVAGMDSSSGMGGSLSEPDVGGGSNADILVGGSTGGAGAFQSTGNKALDLLLDIELPLTIELGRTEMSLKRVLDLGPGSIVEMDRLFGEPVDLLINGKVVARGEVVVVDENFGIRIVSLVAPEERIKMLR